VVPFLSGIEINILPAPTVWWYYCIFGGFMRIRGLRLRSVGIGVWLPLTFLGGCMSVPEDAVLVSRYFPSEPIPSLHFLEARGRRIHYAELGDKQLPLVIFVHGTPVPPSSIVHPVSA